MWATARRMGKVALGIFALTCAAIAAFALLHPDTPAHKTDVADVIVVLGAGMDTDGTLHRSSVLRVETGVKLWKAGLAPRLHFTGGMGKPGGPSAGSQMAALAGRMGVPEDVMTHEGRSLSTLQNALFSQPQLKSAKHLRLVTEGFHLPRSWLSFKWAAWHEGAPVPRISLTHSERLRKSSANASWPRLTMVLRESAALWFNALRVAAFEVGTLASVADQRREAWLD